MSQLTDHNETLINHVERQKVEIATRDGEIEQLRANMSPMESQLGSRSSTVQELRETIRRLEQKVHEQDLMIQQTVKAAELKDVEIEALEENAKTQAAFDPVLSLNLSSSRVALNDQLDALSVLSNDMEEQHREILAQQARVTKMKEDMARSTSVSADEAKNFQAQITSLEAQRSKLGVDIAEATSEAARLSGEIVQLDTAWQNRDNPFSELRRRVDAVAGNVERVAKAINRESIVKSVLAALPGGKAAKGDEAAPEETPQESTAPALEAVPPAAEAAPAQPTDAQVAASTVEKLGQALEESAPRPVAARQASEEAADPSAGAPPPAAGDTAPTMPEVVPLEAIKPGAPSTAPKPKSDKPATDSAKKGTRARRVMSLAERIRSFQNEAN